MIDQGMVAAITLLAFALFGVGYYIGQTELKSRRPANDVHSGRDDVEARARRVA